MKFSSLVVVVFKAHFLLLLIGLLCVIHAQSVPTKPPAKPQKPDPVHDVIAQTFKSNLACDASTPAPDLSTDLTALKNGQEVNWSTGNIHKLVAEKTDCKLCSGVQKDASYIFHVVNWKQIAVKGDTVTGEAATAAALVSSDWYVYQKSKGNNLEPAKLKGNGDPLIYGMKRIVIVGIDILDSDGFLGISYKTTATQGTPQNWQDLGELLSALAGIAGGGTGFVAPSPTTKCKVFVAAAVQDGTKHLPFDLNVSYMASDPNGQTIQVQQSGPKLPPQNSSPGVTQCAGDGRTAPCSMNRTFTSDDWEWWDVSVGVTTPGVRESTFSISNGALQMGTTRHTDAYGLFDIFPFFAKAPKDSPYPHFNLGVPLATKSLWRPYFGMAESLTTWKHLQQKLNLPVSINVFAGVVWMKTQFVTDDPTTTAELAAELRTKRVWKGLFGIEIPVSSIASKIGKSNKNSNGAGKSSGQGGS